MNALPHVDLLIFQATPFCNINCSYCYLPNRLDKKRILPSVVSKAAQALIDVGYVGNRISVVWHAGEPLTVGAEYLEQLIDACTPLQQVARVQHHVQTNAILINSQFCELFKTKRVKVCVSIDGPRNLHDGHRVTRSGKGTFDMVMRSINLLREFEINFDVICVLTSDSLHRAEELYDFFSTLGALTVGFNIDEIEGTNRSSSMDNEGFFEELSEFWDTMLSIHFQRRAFRLREVDSLLETIRYRDPNQPNSHQLLDPFSIITVAVDGSIGTFSPELLGQYDPRYGDFSIGNICSESMTEISTSSRFLKMKKDIEAGIHKCSQQCSYFELCGGGAPSNKISEHGTFDATETKYCRTTKMMLIDSLIRTTKSYQFAGQT